MNQQLDDFEQQFNCKLEDSFMSLTPSFPVHPSNPYNNNATIAPINQFISKLYNPSWIYLQDQIHYQENQEYLKRIYLQRQQNKKIKLLGEYYRYHFEAPRLFLKQLGDIVEENVQEKRVLQYFLVTKEMEKGEDSSKSIEPKNYTTRLEPHKKLIKDIELSYNNFQLKQETKREKKFSSQKANQKISSKNKSQKAQINRLKTGQLQLVGNKQKNFKRTTSIKSNKGFFVCEAIQKTKVKDKKIEIKKNPKEDKKKVSKERSKKNIVMKKNLVNLKLSEKQNQNARQKRISVNTSIASSSCNPKKTLSRSQSKTQLNTLRLHHHQNMLASARDQKNFKRENKTLKTSASQTKFQQNYHSNKQKIGSSKNSSQQNSLIKSSHKKSKNTVQKQNKQKIIKHEKESIHKISYGLKESIEGATLMKANEQNKRQNKKLTSNKNKQHQQQMKNSWKSSMFNRAIQIRKNK